MRGKKPILWVCIFTMLLSCFCLSAGAAETVSLELQIPAALPAVGETFEAVLSVTENPGISSAGVALSYNRAVLRCTDMENGELLNGTLCVSNPAAKSGAMLGAVSEPSFSGTGVLVVYTFEVLAPGNSDFSLKGSEFSDGENSLRIALTLSSGGEAGGAGAVPSVPEQPPVSPSGSGGEQIEEVPPPRIVFPDVKADSWAAENISRAAAMGLVTGRPDGNFDPNGKMTRAEFATVLWRLNGSPQASKTADFPDVSSSNWFCEAVSWAAEQGIVNGTEVGFSPNGEITREQIATILFRMSGGVSGAEMMFRSTYESNYEDSEEVHSWAQSGMYWCIYKELIKGTSDTTLSPRKAATRAEVVTLVLRYADKMM